MVADPMLVAAQSQVSAAWVQAWGSVVAIFASGLIAAFQVSREASARRSAELLLARDHAMLIARDVRDWGSLARGWIEGLNLESGMGEWALIDQAATNMSAVFGPPGPVKDAIGEFRHFGAAAHSLQRAMVAWEELNAYRGEIRNMIDAADAETRRITGRPKVVALLRKYAGAVLMVEADIERLRRS